VTLSGIATLPNVRCRAWPARNAEYLRCGRRLDAFRQTQPAADSPAKADRPFAETSERTLGCIDLCYRSVSEIEEGSMDRDQRIVRVHSSNDRRIKDRQGARVERAAGMKAQLWRQDCEVPGGEIPLANCPLKVSRLPPQAQPVALSDRFELQGGAWEDRWMRRNSRMIDLRSHPAKHVTGSCDPLAGSIGEGSIIMCRAAAHGAFSMPSPIEGSFSRSRVACVGLCAVSGMITVSFRFTPPPLLCPSSVENFARDFWPSED
jgi:hypothetical protein